MAELTLNGATGGRKRPGVLHSEPITKQRPELFHGQYVADTCDAYRTGDDLRFPEYNEGEDNEVEMKADDEHAMGNLEDGQEFLVAEINEATQGDFLRVQKTGRRRSIHDELDSLRRSIVTKQEFQRFEVKFNALFEMVQNAVKPDTSLTSQSLLTSDRDDEKQEFSLRAAQMRKYCEVNYDGIDHPLMLPQSMILRIEAASTKRGICKEILRYLHPEKNYFDRRTVTGRTKNRTKKTPEADGGLDEAYEPVPALSIKFCLAVVNTVKPMDKSRYNEAVLSEELNKYDNDTITQLSRAIIDIRGDDLKAKLKG